MLRAHLDPAKSATLPSSSPSTLKGDSTCENSSFSRLYPPLEDRIRTSDGRLEPTAISAQGIPQTTADITPVDHAEGSDIGSVRRTLFQAGEGCSQRPATSPMPLTSLTLDSLSQMLPPKRELPFLKPASRRPQESFLESKHAKRTKTMNSDILTRLAEPMFQKKAVSRKSGPKKGASTIQPVLSSLTTGPSPLPSLNSAPTASNSKTTKSPTVPLPKVSKDLKLGPAAPLQRVNDHQPQIPLPSDRDAAKEGTETINHTTSKQGSQPDPAAVLDTASTAAQVIPAISPSKPETQIASTSTAPEPRHPALAAYAALPEAERRAGLNHVIMELLMDDNFKTLCEDMDASWRRSGLTG